MDVRQLAALVAIADHGTFSAAARALYTVQSNISGHIAKLERELGATLVDRSHGGLTDEGERVVERARRVLHEIDDIAADIASLNDEVSGDARIGVIGTAARWMMAQLLETIGREYPRVRPTILEGSTSTLIPNVISGALNAAVVHLPIDEPELVIEPLFAEDLVLLTPTDHPLATESARELHDLHDIPLLLPPPGTAMRRVLDRAAGAAGITLAAQAEIDGVRLLASLVIDGHGIAIVPATTIPRSPAQPFARINLPELPRRVVAWARRRRPAPSAATQAVHDALERIIAASADEQPGIWLGDDAIASTRAP